MVVTVENAQDVMDEMERSATPNQTDSVNRNRLIPTNQTRKRIAHHQVYFIKDRQMTVNNPNSGSSQLRRIAMKFIFSVCPPIEWVTRCMMSFFIVHLPSLMRCSYMLTDFLQILPYFLAREINWNQSIKLVFLICTIYWPHFMNSFFSSQLDQAVFPLFSKSANFCLPLFTWEPNAIFIVPVPGKPQVRHQFRASYWNELNRNLKQRATS